MLRDIADDGDDNEDEAIRRYCISKSAFGARSPRRYGHVAATTAEIARREMRSMVATATAGIAPSSAIVHEISLCPSPRGRGNS